MTENTTNINTLDLSKLIQTSTSLNNLLNLTDGMADAPIDIPLNDLFQLKRDQPNIYKALKQYNVLIHIIGAIKLMSDDIEDEINNLCEKLLDEGLL